MSKMKTQLVGLALRPLTMLKPRTRNKTRWVSTFLMVERYFRFKVRLTWFRFILVLLG